MDKYIILGIGLIIAFGFWLYIIKKANEEGKKLEESRRLE